MNKSKPPLVVHIIYALDTGGLENGLVNIINRSPPERYRHAIICLTTAEDFSRRITAPDVSVIEMHMKPGHDIGLYWKLWLTLLKLKPAIIHSRNLAALETQFLGVITPGVKRVHGEHGRDISDLDGSNWKYLLLRKFSRFLISRYVAVSQDLAQWLVDSVGVKPNRVRQIYNGVDHSRFNHNAPDFHRADVLPSGFLNSKDDTIVFGTVGRLVAVKDQNTLLMAFHKLLEERPEWHGIVRLVIVGGGALEAQLRAQIKALKLDELVWMAGERNDIPQLLQSMDVFVLPSLAEGVSNTVLEAFATGLPVIATDVGGSPELVESSVNGLLVAVGDVAEMSAAMIALAESNDTRAQMGKRALSRVQTRFDWDKTVNNYLEMYDELLGRDSTGATEATTG